MEFMYLVFTRMPGESYRRQLRSLLLYLCYVFRALLTPLCVDSIVFGKRTVLRFDLEFREGFCRRGSQGEGRCRQSRREEVKGKVAAGRAEERKSREGRCRQSRREEVKGKVAAGRAEERRRGNKRTIDFIDKGADSQAPAIANELFISTSTKHWHYDEATGDGSAMPVKGRDRRGVSGSSYLQTGRQWQFVFTDRGCQWQYVFTDRGCQWQLAVRIYRQVVSVAVHIYRDREGFSGSSYSQRQRGCQ